MTMGIAEHPSAEHIAGQLIAVQAAINALIRLSAAPQEVVAQVSAEMENAIAHFLTRDTASDDLIAGIQQAARVITSFS